MKNYYKRIVIGASFYGCGVAAASPEDTLLIEPSILVGSDYTLNFNPGTQWDYQPSHSLARKFLDELKNRNVLSRQKLHQPALSPIFSQWCIDSDIEIALSSRVIEQSKNSLVVFDIEGRHKLSAGEIIDATPKVGTVKNFTASLFSNGPDCEGCYDDFEIIAGRFETEAFLLMPVPVGTSYPDARMKLFNAWRKRPEILKKCSIAATGVRFDCNNFPNPIIALDEGLSRGENVL